MKSFWKFFVIFVAVLLLSAFFAPILYDFLPFKFERIFNRLVMIGTLLAIVMCVRVRKETVIKYGLIWKKTTPVLFLVGFFSGLATLCSTSVVNVLLEHARFVIPSLTVMEWFLKISLALLTGLLIGTIEEFFFRGFVFRGLQKSLSGRVVPAILITSTFYALIHFIGMKKLFIGPDPGFVDGLKLIAAPFLSLSNWPQFWPEAVGLFLFGIALNIAVYRSGSLYPSIGLHAGCVFFVRLDDLFLKFQTKWTLFWGSKIAYDGIIGWVFLAVLAALFFILFRPATFPQQGE